MVVTTHQLLGKGLICRLKLLGFALGAFELRFQTLSHWSASFTEKLTGSMSRE